MSKKPKPRMIGGVEVEPIDILAMELNQKLPYWLSPYQRYSRSADGRTQRLKLYREQWAKRHGK